MTESKASSNTDRSFLVGDWRVHPDRNVIAGPGGIQRLEPMSMKLLLLLAENGPRTTTRDEIVERLWGGRIVTEDAISKQISKLRSAIEDDDSASRAIQTISKIGIRLTLPVKRPQPIGGQASLGIGIGRPALALLAILAVIAFVAMIDRGGSELSLVQEPATAIPGTEVEPALSADGEWLAYSGKPDVHEHFGLFVRPLRGEQPRRLTPPGVDGRAPSWSPDGRLAFILRSGRGCQIVVGPPSGDYRPVGSCIAAELGGLAWLDSDRLIVSDRPGTGRSHQLDILDLRSGKRERLVDPPTGDVGDLHPLVSADRRHVYFLRNRSVGPSEIFSVRLGERKASPVTADGAAINGLALGPHGDLLVSTQRGGRGFSLWLLKPERNQWHRLIPGAAAGLASTADGRRAIFSKADRQVTLWRLPLAGGEGTALAASTHADWSPVVSPDQNHLAFLSNRSGDWEVWLLDLGSGAVRRLTRFGGPAIQDLHWSRDGRMIATSVASQGQFDLHLIDVASGSVRQVAATREDERQPVFLNDGRTLWFVRRAGINFQLRSYDLVSRREMPLLNDVMRALPAADGKRAFLVRPFTNGLWSANIPEGAMTRLVSWPDVFQMRNVDIRPDGIWITASGAETSLIRVDAASGRSEPVRILPEIARPSGIALLGDDVVYARLRRDEADLVAIRFER